MTKEEFRKSLEDRLSKRLEKQTFDEMTVGGSQMRFDMALAIVGSPFGIPEGADEKDYEPLITDKDYESGKYDSTIELVFNEALLKYGKRN